MKFARLLLLLFVLPLCLRAQDDSAAFHDLRPDGNGVSALHTTVLVGFSNRTASDAYELLALQAHINLTLDAAHPAFQALVAIPAHQRTAAVALLEIAELS